MIKTLINYKKVKYKLNKLNKHRVNLNLNYNKNYNRYKVYRVYKMIKLYNKNYNQNNKI